MAGSHGDGSRAGAPASHAGSRAGHPAGHHSGHHSGHPAGSQIGSLAGSRAGPPASYAGSRAGAPPGTYAGSHAGSRAGSHASFAGSAHPSRINEPITPFDSASQVGSSYTSHTKISRHPSNQRHGSMAGSQVSVNSSAVSSERGKSSFDRGAPTVTGSQFGGSRAAGGSQFGGSRAGGSQFGGSRAGGSQFGGSRAGGSQAGGASQYGGSRTGNNYGTQVALARHPSGGSVMLGYAGSRAAPSDVGSRYEGSVIRPSSVVSGASTVRPGKVAGAGSLLGGARAPSVLESLLGGRAPSILAGGGSVVPGPAGRGELEVSKPPTAAGAITPGAGRTIVHYEYASVTITKPAPSK